MFQCQFAQSCWKYICPSVSFLDTDGHFECILKLKEQLNKPFFMEIIILGTWAIWLTRNNAIFNQMTPNLFSTRAIFKSELKWLKYRAKRKSYTNFAAWADHFS
uniref:Uncharacterized protein n=1 Tax=Avena sativa TaxID=4498 RepID=A0ACD5VR07_AVESA